MKTVTEFANEYQTTRADIVLELSKNLSRISAERALTRNWKEHPMFGIESDSDRWAIEYQKTLSKLKEILFPHAEDK